MIFKRLDPSSLSVQLWEEWSDDPMHLHAKEFFDQHKFLMSVAQWSEYSGCGRSSTYGKFEFATEADLMFFMLKWS